jgi:acetoin utilization deacetylase AcuC-like enzyme
VKTAIIQDPRYLDHMPGHTHPEHPSRLRAVYEMLEKDPPGDLLRIPATLATLEELERVHTPTYVKKVLKTADQPHTTLSPDTPASSKSYLSAWLAVGGCLRGLDALMAHRCDACFCLVRPPGHHALADRAGGFCFFNNLAITARQAMDMYGLQRILIIDWDIHFGNGFQEQFSSEPSPLCFSTHDMLLYPFSGDMEMMGDDRGAGHMVNVPLLRQFEDGDLLHIYREILTPVVRRYRPELILVAAGFDGHREDPIGRSRFSSRVYGDITRMLLTILPDKSRPPLLLSLEGGYHSKALARSVREVLSALLGTAPETPSSAEPTPEAVDLVARVKALHRPHGVWIDF